MLISDNDLHVKDWRRAKDCARLIGRRPRVSRSSFLYPEPMAVMAWFKKERKPRISQRTQAGDSEGRLGALREAAATSTSGSGSSGRSTSAPNAATTAGSRPRSTSSCSPTPGTWREFFAGLRSQDPLNFENYADRLVAAEKKAGRLGRDLHRVRPAGRAFRTTSA